MPPIVVSSDKLKSLEDGLCNANGVFPLHTRFRALFTLKALKSEDAVRIISKGVCIQNHSSEGSYFVGTAFEDQSALLKHELAYCLGQMKMKSALPTLESVLRDTSEDPMVRHEVNCAIHPFIQDLHHYSKLIF